MCVCVCVWTLMLFKTDSKFKHAYNGFYANYILKSTFQMTSSFSHHWVANKICPIHFHTQIVLLYVSLSHSPYVPHTLLCAPASGSPSQTLAHSCVSSASGDSPLLSPLSRGPHDISTVLIYSHNKVATPLFLPLWAPGHQAEKAQHILIHVVSNTIVHLP